MASGHLNWLKREPGGSDSHGEAANKMKGRKIVSPNGGNRDPGQNSPSKTEKSILNDKGVHLVGIAILKLMLLFLKYVYFSHSCC